MNAPIHIALSGDSQALLVFPTLIASILRHTQRRVEVVIYTRDLRGDNFTGNQLKVEFLHPRIKIPNRTRYVPPEMFDRFFVLEDKPEWERAFLFDWDQLIIGSLEELWNTPMESTYGAFVREDASWTFQGRGWVERGDWSTDLPGSEQVFFRFGGLLNLHHCRAHNLLERMLELGRTESSEQAIFASLTAGNYVAVDRKWNVFPTVEPIPEDARVLHWFGSRKPWNASSVAHGDLWLQARTTWQNLYHSQNFPHWPPSQI